MNLKDKDNFFYHFTSCTFGRVLCLVVKITRITKVIFGVTFIMRYCTFPHESNQFYKRHLEILLETWF